MRHPAGANPCAALAPVELPARRFKRWANMNGVVLSLRGGWMIFVELFHFFSEHIDDEEDNKSDCSDRAKNAVIKIPACFSKAEGNARC